MNSFSSPLRCWCLLFALIATAFGQASSSSGVSVPRFTHPGAGEVFYFVLTDRFANGDFSNDNGHLNGGPDVSGFDPTRISHYHGGDFSGLTRKLDYIQRLGATAVWVTPPFKNKPMQSGTAGYHGYWVLDFLHIDPHLGTDAEFDEFVRQAHARGLKVYMDIIVNHTADVISYQGGGTDYIDKATSPYRDAHGQPFDERAFAYNGLNASTVFPPLSPERSFPRIPVVVPDETHAKNPDWLNDPRHYHNRGNSLFRGENSLYGDFVGLDDLFTEQPEVVRGFIDIYSRWIDEHGVDGFRIDTAKHVNLEFWQAFAPAIRENARAHGRPGFIQFGEVSTDTGDVPLLSAFSTDGQLDTTLDFGFFRAARQFVSQGHPANELNDFFALDDYYTDHAGNVQTTTTFLGNHDAGRFAYFLKKDNPDATNEQLVDLVKLGHALLLLSRGQPVLYYGDEQGMIGRGGDDMQAREDMFASRAAAFRNAPLLATSRTGADEKYDEQHPFFHTFHELASLRVNNPALSRGAMVLRASENPNLFAFSRIERHERVEYLVVLNNSRTGTLKANVPTSQHDGAEFSLLYASQSFGTDDSKTIRADQNGQVSVSLGPLQYQVWRAKMPLAEAKGAKLDVILSVPKPGSSWSISNRGIDGHTLPIRQEIRAEVSGGDEVNEVTFAMTRASRPGQYELLGVDDAPPYRVFWHPPADLAPNDSLTFIATVNNLRGVTRSARVDGITVANRDLSFGIRGSSVPKLTRSFPSSLVLQPGAALSLTAEAEGTGPLHYTWLKNGEEIPSATTATLSLSDPSTGSYRVMVRGLAGTTLSDEVAVTVR